MGQSASSSAEGSEQQPAAAAKTVSRHVATFRKLYRELTAQDPARETANDDMFRTQFQEHFGGPHLELGHLIYQHAFDQVTTFVSMEMFVSMATELERVCTRGSSEERESLIFRIFAEGADVLNGKALSDMVWMSASFALVIGSELHDHQTTGVPRDHALISALLDSAWKMTDTERRELSLQEFHQWTASHCPRLLDGLSQWITSSLLLINLEGEGQEAESRAAQPTVSHSSLYYRLPAPHLAGEDEKSRERVREMQIQIWSLSTVLPLAYMGHNNNEDKSQVMCDYPLGGSWTLLYSSSQHGFSMNRFQHHCSDYREPSVMLLECRTRERGGDGERGEYKFAIAVDMEWKDGTFNWGGEKFRLLQLQPTFSILSSGSKMISLNEKRRGFPTGLRVMSSSDPNHAPILEVDSALETVRYHDTTMAIARIEVWGCGGERAAETQRKMKDWEKQLILKRRKIKASTIREEWSNSPDRYILEMGGVKTNRPTEQQQQ